MNIEILEVEYPLTHKALSLIGNDNCGAVLNPQYEFSDDDCMTQILVGSELTLAELKGRKVADVISKDVIKMIRKGIPWDRRDDEEWDVFSQNSALEMAVCSEQDYMDALSATTWHGGEVLQSFLTHCFDGDYSYDSNGRDLFILDERII